jgi:uncharacterized membrane protein YqgA involved in biofilm formation
MTWGTLAGGAAILWGAIVGLAYARRPFGGSSRNYVLAFVGLWVVTMAVLALMAIAERH